MTEVITYEELLRRYEMYCKGEYPNYEKEHNKWIIKCEVVK